MIMIIIKIRRRIKILTTIIVIIVSRKKLNKYDLLECVDYFVRPEIDQPQGVVPDTAQ